MTEIINESRRRAKKIHICDLCHENINPGQSYFYQFLRDGGDLWEFKAHDSCEFIMKELWDYIDPYEYMDDIYYQEGVTSFCKQFICSECEHFNKEYFNNCDKEEGYCLSKVEQLLRKYEVHKERNYNNPIFVKWYLKARNQEEQNVK